MSDQPCCASPVRRMDEPGIRVVNNIWEKFELSFVCGKVFDHRIQQKKNVAFVFLFVMKGFAGQYREPARGLPPLPGSQLPVETYSVLRSPLFQARSAWRAQAFQRNASASCVVCSPLKNVFMDHKCSPLAAAPFMLNCPV